MPEKKKKTAVLCQGITKRFGTVVANDSVDLEIKYGEILALLGENGSGKTTLVNMLSGIYHPDSGKIFVDGKEAAIQSPVDATELGIGMIHQHFKLVDVFNVMDNIVMGTKEKRIQPKALRERVLNISEQFGLLVEPEKKIYNMSVSEKQTVEIMKVLYRGARILILDEPTAVLTPQETKKLFEILERMKDQGTAIVIITHKLNEVMEISDRVTILRKGKSAGTVETATTNENKLTELMVGHAVSLEIKRPKVEDTEMLVKVENVSALRPDGTRGLKDISFTINRGEILGVAGVAGSGQKELCEVLAGLCPTQSGKIIYDGQDITGKPVGEIRNMGIRMGFVPEDRLGMGLIASMGMVDNMLLKTYGENKGPKVDRKPAKRLSKELITKLEIKTPGMETPVRMLSGGNVQKVLLGREIESEPDLLITAYPVRGLDIHSSYTIYDLLNEQKQKKTAVLYVGEDLDVLLALADRIMVLCHGKVTGIVDAAKTTKEEIGRLMAGISKGEG